MSILKLKEPLKGEWILPEFPEEKLNGILIQKDDTIFLELSGLFSKGEPKYFGAKSSFLFSEANKNFDLIIGETEDGEKYTLIENFRRSGVFRFSGFSTQIIRPMYLIKGILIGKFEDIKIKEVLVSLNKSDFWDNRDWNNIISGLTNINIPEKSVRTFETNEQYQLQLIQFYHSSPDFRKRDLTITQINSLKIELKEYVEFEELIDSLRIIERFFSLVTREAIYFDRIQSKIENSDEPERIEIFYNRSLPMETDFRHHHYFRLEDLPNNLSEMVNLWIKNYNIMNHTYGDFFRDTYGNIESVRSRFLNMLICLEQFEKSFELSKKVNSNESEQKFLNYIPKEYHSEFKDLFQVRNDTTLSKRVNNIRELFGDQVSKILRQEIDLGNKMGKIRNGIAHLGSKSKEDDVSEIYEYFLVAKCMVELCMLKQLNIDPHLVDKHLSNSFIRN